MRSNFRGCRGEMADEVLRCLAMETTVTLSGTFSLWSSLCRSVDSPRTNYRVLVTTLATALSIRCKMSVIVFGKAIIRLLEWY